jgi:hypothetical protein
MDGTISHLQNVNMLDLGETGAINDKNFSMVTLRRMLRRAPICKTSFAGHVRTLSSRLSATILQRKNATQGDVLSLVTLPYPIFNSIVAEITRWNDVIRNFSVEPHLLSGSSPE